MTDGTDGYVIRHGRRIAIRTIETIGTKPKSKSTERFVKVPLWWAEQVCRATKTPKAFVALWLLHLAWKAKSNTFPVPNGQLYKNGVHRRTKDRALWELEKAGLILVERKPRKTPVFAGREALCQLRPEYRTVFLLFHEQGQPYEDIALAMNRPVGTIKTWLHRARLEILQRLRKRGMVPEAEHELR